MPCFDNYLSDRQFDVLCDRIARKMVHLNVEPYAFIGYYLEWLEYNPKALLTEGWISGFFKRLGAAWKAFWKKPKDETPANKLEDAKQALQDLIKMLKQTAGAGQPTIATVLRGLEQAMGIIQQVEPQVKQLDQDLAQGGKITDQAQLPPDLHARYMALMQAHDRLMQLPDDQDKLKKVTANDDELQKFFSELEQAHQTMNPYDPQQAQRRQQIQNFLQQVDNDTAFREIQNLMDFARRRMAGSSLTQLPQGYEQVVLAYRNIAGQTQDRMQQKQALINWYQQLQPFDPIKVFVQRIIQGNPTANEHEIFWKYANQWINKANIGR